MITNEQFKQLFPHCSCVDELITALNVLLPKYEINKVNLAHFNLILNYHF